MVLQSPARRDVGAELRQAGYRVTEWVLGIFGAIGAFVGAFILLAPDDQYVGLGGETTSRAVGEIAPAWGYGMVIGGVLLMVAAAALAIGDRQRGVAGLQLTGWGDVLAHSVAFVVVNAFLWIQDIALGDGLNYAYWLTIPWAVGLAAHAFSVYTGQHAPPPAIQ
jgi:hypothetical protein